MMRKHHPLLRGAVLLLWTAACWRLFVPALDVPTQELRANALASMQGTLLLLLLAGCGEKQAFNPIVFVAGHSADSLTNAAGERLQGDPELGFDNDATTMEIGESYSTNLSYCFEIPRTTSLTLHSQYNPVIESASTEFLLHSDAVECRLDATYAEDGELTFEIDAESCRLRGDDMEYSLVFDYGCEDKTTLTIKAAGSQEVTVTYRNGNVVIQSDTAFTLRQFAPGSDETERFYDFPAGRTVITSSTVEGVTWK